MNEEYFLCDSATLRLIFFKHKGYKGFHKGHRGNCTTAPMPKPHTALGAEVESPERSRKYSEERGLVTEDLTGPMTRGPGTPSLLMQEL